MKAALLPDRGVVKVAGEKARTFLNGLLTTDIEHLAPGTARFAALLTPQGKIIADCIVTEAPAEDGGGLFLDCPAALTATLLEKLTFYRLRAKVTLEDLSGALGVLAVWGGEGTSQSSESEYGLAYPDPRLPALGLRVILPPATAKGAAADLGAALVEAGEYEAHRIALGVPRGGLDFTYNDAFPHEADMDQFAGVDFKKGCFVGQEVVSRMEHRGTARKRVVPVEYDGASPDAGVPVMAEDRNIGVMGSSAQGQGLAMLRLDRAQEAIDAGAPLLAGGVTIRLRKADWARFPIPGASEKTG